MLVLNILIRAYLVETSLGDELLFLALLHKLNKSEIQEFLFIPL